MLMPSSLQRCWRDQRSQEVGKEGDYTWRHHQNDSVGNQCCWEFGAMAVLTSPPPAFHSVSPAVGLLRSLTMAATIRVRTEPNPVMLHQALMPGTASGHKSQLSRQFEKKKKKGTSSIRTQTHSQNKQTTPPLHRQREKESGVGGGGGKRKETSPPEWSCIKTSSSVSHIKTMWGGHKTTALRLAAVSVILKLCGAVTRQLH